jgi:predicted hydrocarbon binding protein
LISIEKSGYHYPNYWMRAFLLALEDVLGKNGVSALLNMAGLNEWSSAYPPDDLEKAIDFSVISAIQWSLEEVYGPRGGRNLARRAAHTALSQFSEKVESTPPADESAPGDPPINKSLPALKWLAELLTNTCDQTTTIDMDGERVLLRTNPCPFCWGRKCKDPCCNGVIGYIEHSLQVSTSQQAYLIKELKCLGMGDDHCEFSIQAQT